MPTRTPLRHFHRTMASGTHSMPSKLTTRPARAATSLVGAVALAMAVGIPANAAGSTGTSRIAGSITTVTSSTWNALSAALAKGGTINIDCTGGIAVPAPIVVAAARKLILEAPLGQQVLLVSQQNASSTSRLFDVQAGADLTLNNLLIVSATVEGNNGTVGASGTNGLAAQSDGGNGASGTAGHPGTAGDPAQGGAMRIASGATVVIKDCMFNGNTVQGGQGGDGGDGGGGGAGGGGRGGGDDGGQGSAGGTGGNGADSAVGSHGGKAEGGAIYNGGDLTLIDDSFNQDMARGGQGGQGGYAGQAGWPGGGGGGGPGSSSTTADSGGSGGNGGDEGHPGRGGNAAAG